MKCKFQIMLSIFCVVKVTIEDILDNFLVLEILYSGTEMENDIQNFVHISITPLFSVISILEVSFTEKSKKTTFLLRFTT